MRLFHFAWLALLFAGGVCAEEDAVPPTAAKARELELWIPRKELPAALKSAPRAVLLTREQYETLRRDAQPPAAVAGEDAPVPVVLRSLTMQARGAGDVVVAEAELTVDALSTEPAALPLHFEPAVLAALTLDDAGTLTRDAEVPSVLLSPGRHVIKATLHYAVNTSAAGHTIAVRGAVAGASSFSLTLPVEERIESALSWRSGAAENGSVTHTFHVPAGEKPHAITWSRRDIRDLAGTAVMQSCDYRYTLDAVRLHAELSLQLTARLAALPQAFKLPLPAEVRVLSVEGEEVLGWETAADKKGITVTLTQQADRHDAGFTVTLDVESKQESGKPRALTLPFPQAEGVHRASGRFSVLTEGELRVRRITAPPLCVQNSPANPEPGLAGLWDFAAITTPPAVETEELKPVFHATQDMQVELRRDGVHLTRHLSIVPRAGRLFQTILTLPEGEEITALTHKDGSPVDWRKQGATDVELRFPAGLKPGQSPALLLITRLDPPQWSALPEAGMDLMVSPLTVQKADKVSGFLAVNTEDRFALATGVATGLEPRDAAALGDDVPVRGSFVWFAPGDFGLPLHVSPRVAEFDARVAAFALPMRHGVEIEGSLELDVRQSSLRQLTVTLPPGAAPDWHCDSPLLSSAQFNKERSEWILTFRSEVRGKQSLRWRLLLPVKSDDPAGEFTADLPVLRVPGARRSTVHWVVEANTDTELSFTASGLDDRDTLTLPAVEGYVPRHRVIAAWAARGNEWRLGLTARRHQAAPLPVLVVDRYELTTTVSAGGKVRHQAVLTVRANGQPFLDLPLPDGASILSLLVNGTVQKPAASGTAALRAELPAGNTSAVSVSLTWEAAGPSWDGTGERKVEPLKFPESVPVIESHWTLRLPEGFVYSDFEGDLERVDGPASPRFELFSPKYGSTNAAPEFLAGGTGGAAGEVKFQVRQSSAPDLFGTTATSQRNAVSGKWEEVQSKIITSQDNMLRVVKEFKLDDKWGMDLTAAAERLASMTEVETENDTDSFVVRVKGVGENEASRLARAIVAAFEVKRAGAEKERLHRLNLSVQAQEKAQVEIVDKNRLEMNELMKKHNIYDVVPLSIGGQFSQVIPPGLSGAEQTRRYDVKLEEDVMKMDTQLKTLAGLKGEQLIAGAAELGVSNSTLQKLYPEYQMEVSNRAAALTGGLGKDHPKIKAMDESIAVMGRQLDQAAELYRKNIEVQLESSRKMLEDARKRLAGKTITSETERQNQAEYAAAKKKLESSMMLLNSMRELSARQNLDEVDSKMSIETGITPPVTATPKAVAGLLPMEIALPDAGEAFHFRGFHAPGTMTFSVRSLRQESQAAWLWIGAGLAAAGVWARRRTWWRGMLVALLLWLGPWVAGMGMGVCHRLLIGWITGCVVVLGWRLAGKACGGVRAAAAVLLTLLLAGITEVRAAVLVPYDPEQPLAGQQSQQVYVDYALFQKLWEQARDNRLARNAPAVKALAGAEAAILSALYEASVNGGVLKVEAMLTLHTTGEWGALDLRENENTAPFAGMNVVSLLLDGKPAVLHGGLLLVEKPGRHVLRASLQTALAADWRTVSVALPASAAAVLSLTHSDPSLRLKVNGGPAMEVRETREPAYSWRGTVALGRVRTLQLQRLPAVTLAAGSEKPTHAAVSARVLVTPALERVDSRIDYVFAGVERRDFSFAFDASLTPVQIAIANLESWTVKDAEGKRVLDFHLSVPARDGLTARFVAERAVVTRPGDEHEAPAILPAANRQEFTMEILSSDELELTANADGGWARSELQGMGNGGETGFRNAGAWRLAGTWTPLTWSATARVSGRKVQADYAYKITGRMLETTVTLVLRAGEHEDLSSLTIPLPAGASLQTLDGERLRDWWREGGGVEVRFGGATGETTTVWLDFTQSLSDEHLKTGAPLPCLTIPGFEEASGRGVIATGPEVDVRLRLEEKQAEAREVDAAEARGDYRFLPPLVLRRGFSYEVPVFHAIALLETVSPRFAARWVLGAAVQDTWTEAQFRVDLEVSQGALPEAVFVMPAGVLEARVAGPAVRETVRKVAADGRAEYRVIFQSPVSTAVALTVSLELPHTGRLALPDIVWPGAALTERFLIMQNFSGGEIVPDLRASQGVEPLSREMLQDLHFTVQGFSNPLSWRLQENWKLVADYRALETTSGPKAVVLYAELTTMLRPEGPEWLRAVYHLQNRALQFLPLRLPEGAELVSVTVAGSPVRADTGMLPDGKPGLLIPLIQTRPGDLAMDVEMVCRAKGSGKGERHLEDPDIPGVSIQRTLWNVWTPPGWELTDEDGNMEPVEERKSFYEKVEADLAEMDSLGSLLSSVGSSAKKRNAQAMSQMLIDDLENKLETREKQYARGGEEELSAARQRLAAAKKLQAENVTVDAAAAASGEGLEEAAFGDSTKWVWDNNSTYLQKRGRETAEAETKTLILQDSLALQNGGVGNVNAAVQGRNVKAEGDKKDAEPARNYNAQIATLNAGFEDAPQRLDMDRGRETTAARKVLEDDVQAEKAQTFFNDVRGVRRRVLMPEQAGGMVPMQQGNAPAPPADTVPAPGTPPETPKLREPALTDGRALGVPAPAPMIKPAGRVSIPVTFPLDGEVRRFRKVNDGASLRLTMKPVSRDTSSRTLAGTLLAAGLGVLWLVNRKTRRAASVRAA